MDFDYIAWGSGEIVVRTLRALAVLTGSGLLSGAMVAASLFSLLFLATTAAFFPSVTATIALVRKLIVLVIVTGVLLLPTRVTVTDRFASQDLLQGVTLVTHGATVVNRVPFGAALPASFASTLGNSLTRAIETAMAPVNAEDRLSRTGLWLSARALQAMLTDSSQLDANLPGDFRRFVVNCTYFDLQNGRIDVSDLRHGDLLTELGQTAGGLTSVHSGANAAGALEPVACPLAWNGGSTASGVIISGLLTRLETQGRWRKFRACHSLQGIGLALSPAQLDAAKTAARNPIVGPVSNCGDRVFQNALDLFGFNTNVVEQFRELAAINLLDASSHTLASQDPQALALATYLGRHQRDATYVIAGELAALTLPALRGILEAVVLVLLPVLLIFGLLFFEQFGAYLKNGFVLVIWLQLWPPVMAVINNVGLWVQIAALNEHAILADGRFSVAGVQALLADIDTQLALSRYMLVLVPLIAWALVRVGQFSGGLLAGRLMQPGEAAAASLSGNVASNNWTTDQVNLQPRTSVGPHVATVGDAWGGTTTMHPQMTTMSMPANEPGHMAVTHTQTLSHGLAKRAETANEQYAERSSQFARSVESSYQQAYGESGSKTLATLRSQGISDATSLRALQGSSEVLRQTSDHMRSVGQREGSSQSQQLGYDGGLSFSVLALRAKLGFGATEDHQLAVDEQMRRSYSQLDDRTKEAMQQVSQALSHSTDVATSTTDATVSSESFTASMQEAHAKHASMTQAQRQSERYSQASEIAQTSGHSVMQEMLKDPRQAEFLSQMHQLYHGQGLSFEQAWSQAQANSGVRLDFDTVATQLLHAELKQEPLPVDDPGAILAASANHRDRVAANAPTPPAPPPEIGQGQQEISTATTAVQQQQLPQPSAEHYDPSRTLDKTVYDADGNKHVVPNESLSEKADWRATRSVADEIGLDVYTEEPPKQGVQSTQEKEAKQ